MNAPTNPLLAELRAINETAALNRWCGIEVIRAGPGKVEIAMPCRGATKSGSTRAFCMQG